MFQLVQVADLYNQRDFGQIVFHGKITAFDVGAGIAQDIADIHEQIFALLGHNDDLHQKRLVGGSVPDDFDKTLGPEVGVLQVGTSRTMNGDSAATGNHT